MVPVPAAPAPPPATAPPTAAPAFAPEPPPEAAPSQGTYPLRPTPASAVATSDTIANTVNPPNALPPSFFRPPPSTANPAVGAGAVRPLRPTSAPGRRPPIRRGACVRPRGPTSAREEPKQEEEVAPEEVIIQDNGPELAGRIEELSGQVELISKVSRTPPLSLH